MIIAERNAYTLSELTHKTGEPPLFQTYSSSSNYACAVYVTNGGNLILSDLPPVNLKPLIDLGFAQ